MIITLTPFPLLPPRQVNGRLRLCHPKKKRKAERILPSQVIRQKHWVFPPRTKTIGLRIRSLFYLVLLALSMAASLRRVLSRPSPLRNLQSWNHVRASSSAKPAVDFSDTKAAFQAKSTTELLTGMLVFSLCKVRPLVERAEPLLKLSYKLLGSGATNLLLRKTFFGHFCAGEDEETIRPVIHKLEKHGVGSILDYAAENDIATESNEIAIPASTTEGKVKARVYDYQSEKVCDEHMNTFERAIKSVHNVSPTGFAAIKCTALGKMSKEGGDATLQTRIFPIPLSFFFVHSAVCLIVLARLAVV